MDLLKGIGSVMQSAAAARELGVSKERVRQLCVNGQLRSVKVGETRLVSKRDVRARKANLPGQGRPKKS